MIERDYVFHGTQEQLGKSLRVLGVYGVVWEALQSIMPDMLSNSAKVDLSSDFSLFPNSVILTIELGAEQQRLVLRCSDRAWRRMAPKWKELIAELQRRGTPQHRKTRGTSTATDANAREAYRLYYEVGLTQAQIAERLSVTERTIKRYLKRTQK